MRFLVLRNHKYKNGLDVHEYLDNGIIRISEDEHFDWEGEKISFSKTMHLLFQAVGKQAFLKNKRFSLGMYEFISLGLSKSIDSATSNRSLERIKSLIAAVPELEEAKKFSGIGSRGSQRLASFVLPMAEKFFAAQSS